MKRLVIDTDPGVDDAHAIMMACAHPGARVEALTVVAGNVGLEHTVANACKILDVMDAEAPVYAGCAAPLVYDSGSAAIVHGSDGLGDLGLAASKRQVEDEHASLALVRLASETPGEMSLVTLGPLTNLALALKLDPQLPGRYQELIVMGGAVNAHGNTTNVSAEFNIFTDPEAAHVVFEAWPRFTLVSWEATLAHAIPEKLLERWMQLKSARARFLVDITAVARQYIREVLGRTQLFAADGLAMAVALEPEIVKKSELHRVTVETAGRITRGQTTVDWYDQLGERPNADLIQKVDQDQFNALLELPLR